MDCGLDGDSGYYQNTVSEIYVVVGDAGGSNNSFTFLEAVGWTAYFPEVNVFYIDPLRYALLIFC